jgi:hypothetical protein
MMLGKLIEKVRTGYAIHQLNKLPGIQYGRDAISNYWTHCKPVIQDFSPKFIEEQAEKMMGQVIQVATSPDPRMANREKLSECVIEYARFQVLVMEPPPADDPTGIRGKPGVTGELKARLLELAQKDKTLREFMHGFDKAKDWDDVWNPVLMRYRIVYAWTHVHHMLRLAYDDWNQTPGKDWFKPYIEAMCAFQEYSYRETLGMPQVLGKTVSRLDANLEALMFSSFMNRVLDGVQYPDLAWNESMEKFQKG